MNITQLFYSAAEKHPNTIAIIEKNKSITYYQLLKEVEQTAAYFSNKGINKGDRVLVFVPMSIDLYRIVLALFSIGATAVFLDEWVSFSRLSVCCQLADCKGFIGGLKASVMGLFSKEIRKIPIKLSLTKRAIKNSSLIDVHPNTPALITFTTGSTGVPKAANRSHQFLQEQFKVLLLEIKPKQSDVDMVVLPIVLFVNLGVGCTSVIANFKMNQPDKLKPSIVIDQISSHKVNRVTASPFFIKKLAEFLIQPNTPCLKLDKIFTGGAPVFPNEAKLYATAFPHTDTTIVYGSTESEPISTIKASELMNKSMRLPDGLPVGVPDNQINVKIIKISDTPISNCDAEKLSGLEVLPGQIGEIIVSGPHVLKQYYKNETAFKANKITVGETIWHRTGDSGKHIDNQLFLHGRCAQLIYTDKKVISPFIIENRIQSIPGVSMGTLLDINGQLALIIESKLNQSELLPLINNIQYHSIHIVKKMPRDPRHNSKIDYQTLKNTIN